MQHKTIAPLIKHMYTIRMWNPKKREAIMFCGIILLGWLPVDANAYFSPGAGLALIDQAVSLLIFFALAISAAVAWPIRKLLRSLTARPQKTKNSQLAPSADDQQERDPETTQF